MDGANDLHYRLFAKLLMFLTFLFGGLAGYFFGVQMGEQNALALLEKGRLSAETTAGQTVTQTESAAADELKKCYEESLGTDRYAQWQAGEGLTVDEVFKVLPCEGLKEE